MKADFEGKKSENAKAAKSIHPSDSEALLGAREGPLLMDGATPVVSLDQHLILQEKLEMLYKELEERNIELATLSRQRGTASWA